MKRFFTQNTRLFMFFCLLSSLGISQSFAQTESKEIHHVIVLIDRSAGMQPEKNKELKNVFNNLERICFTEIDSEIGRPLLGSNVDYLSIISFGLKKLNDPNLKNYISIHTSRNEAFGYSFKKAPAENDLTQFYDRINDIGIRKYKGGFFEFEYAFPTTAIPMAIDYISNESEKYQFNKTFIIRISDKERNDDGIGSELKDYENSINVNAVEEIGNNLSVNFTLKKLTKLSKSFRRKYSTHSYKGRRYYIDAYELNPAIQGVSIESILKFQPTIELERHSKNYQGNITFSSKDNSNFTPLTLNLNYGQNGKTIKLDTLFYSDSSSTVKSSNITIIKNNKSDTVSLLASLVAKYENNFYQGTIIDHHQFPGMQCKINGKFEEIEKVMEIIPMSNWMCGIGKNQKQSKAILNWVFSGILILLIVLGLALRVRYLSRKPYPVSVKQFI